MSDWEQRALAAEANLQALKEKVVPLVSKSKELEKEAKKWKTMYEMAESAKKDDAVTVSGSGTIRKNPSNQTPKKVTLDDGSEVTLEMVQQLQRQITEQKIELDVLRTQNNYVVGMWRKIAVTQYFTKEQLEEHGQELSKGAQAISNFIAAALEELEIYTKTTDQLKSDQDRVERISALKRDLEKQTEVASTNKQEYKASKKELRATKKLAKESLVRVTELEAQLKEEREKNKLEITDLKVQIHQLKAAAASAGPAPASSSQPGQEEAVARSAIDKQVESLLSQGSGSRISLLTTTAATSTSTPTSGSNTVVRGRSDSAATAVALSGIAGVEDGKEIEGGVGQKVVQLKEKKAAAGSRRGGRFDTLRDQSGSVLRTETGLTVIDTNKKLQKMVSHEMNVAKIFVVEGRNFAPKKPAKTGLEIWFKLEMGSATFTSAPVIMGEGAPGIKWGHEYAYVVSTGLQSKPTMPITVYYRRLNSKGQPTDDAGKELGQAIIPLTLFLPLIGSSESLTQWLPVTEPATKEVRGIINVVLRVDSNISTSERMLPKNEGFSKSTLRDNVAGTSQRAAKCMAEECPITELVHLDAIQQKASQANPDPVEICKLIESGTSVDATWKNFRKQSWIHFAAIAGKENIVKSLMEAVGGDIKSIDGTDK